MAAAPMHINCFKKTRILMDAEKARCLGGHKSARNKRSLLITWMSCALRSEHHFKSDTRTAKGYLQKACAII
jgi:hypothetical protein